MEQPTTLEVLLYSHARDYGPSQGRSDFDTLLVESCRSYSGVRDTF